jgi:hypothetical protein
MRVVIVLIALELAVVPAFAGPSAEKLYDEGQHEYDAGHYAAAVELWQEAYDASKLPLLVFNVAQAYRFAGDCLSALATYRRYVALEPKSEQSGYARSFIGELEARCGMPSQPPTTDRSEPVRKLRLVGLGTGGTGIALLVGGLVLGKHASTLGDRVTSACSVSCDWSTQQDTDAAGHRDAAIGYVLDGVGIAAILGGAVVYYVGGRAGRITISPKSQEGGAVVSWSGTW